ncbi:PREDICTED: dual specificity protein phosphatase PHS1-like isoform X1 [Nelumbo nucifera]|uniref:Dual specificity protein phosphatase PHS1-like isoform X1 n=1 Tax=Nelumbo nucifera TaxID=4432 RepID=A0A1U7ZCM2_NELNU|nr:PREDICTED: dual specificity protein phosphatase PHS1-like isoform X1 [Nelumbo nucifera]
MILFLFFPIFRKQSKMQRIMARQEKEETAIFSRTLQQQRQLEEEEEEEAHHHNNVQEREEEDEEREEKDLDLSLSDESGVPSQPTFSSRVLYLLGDKTAGPAYRFNQWLDSVRRRSGRYRSSGFPNRPLQRIEIMPLSAGELILESKSLLPSDQPPDISLWERLGAAAMLDIESSEFSWDMLSSLHHTEHSSSTEHSEDETNRALEVTVNSGGVVFFALFSRPGNDDSIKEAAAVIKIGSSRMATQSERLGYEFAKCLGVRIPQARVIHNSSPEWQQIKEAAEKAKDAAISENDEVGEVTCSELLEALELSRCLLLMNYIHGSPLLESLNAFEPRESAGKTAAALGRILVLDLVIRNEDRLPCRQLGWRGNSTNLLFSDKAPPVDVDSVEEAFDPMARRYRPRTIMTLQKERRVNSANMKLSSHNPELISQSSDVSDFMDSPRSSSISLKSLRYEDAKFSNCHVVVIDTGIPRRPPVGKRTNDQTNYPKLVELILNSAEYSSSLLYEITGGKLGFSLPEEADTQVNSSLFDMATFVHEFRSGFRAALRDLQGFHIFLLTLHQKLDILLRAFLSVTDKFLSGDFDKEDIGVSESPTHAIGVGVHCFSPVSKERCINETHTELSDSELRRTAPRTPTSGYKENPDQAFPISREGWHGKCRGRGESQRSLLLAKLRDFNKFAKLDAELNRELEQWNEMIRSDAIKLCQENNFITGFFEGSDTNSVVDAYELKVRLEHILERIAMISDAANTEKPSSITSSMFIGGALAAKSIYTLQYLGITHILCLCSNEIGQSDSQYPDLFVYKNFSVCDDEDSNISKIFEEASDFIDYVEDIGGRVLIHCFEGRSRSATVVLAYLMLKKNFTLLDAWNLLKKAHRRAQPNDGFARILMELDRKLHGKVSMEWQQRKPIMKVCSICGRNVGLSGTSLRLHLQKSHKKLSSRSADSAMTKEIHKAVNVFKMSRSVSISPIQKHSHSISDGCNP